MQTGARQRRAQKPEYDAIAARAKGVGDVLWERAVQLANILAPDVPADSKELPDDAQWEILQLAAVDFSPSYWDDPQALEDLYRLKRKFTGEDDEQLKALVKQAKTAKRAAIDPAVSPANPDFEKMLRRVGVG